MKNTLVERALGLLKGRWRRLKCLEMEAVEEIPSVVSAGCVLHNFCLLADEGDIEQFLWLLLLGSCSHIAIMCNECPIVQ